MFHSDLQLRGPSPNCHHDGGSCSQRLFVANFRLLYGAMNAGAHRVTTGVVRRIARHNGGCIASHMSQRAYRGDSKSWQKEHILSPQGGAPIPLDLSVRKRRIVYRSKQRGWLELDVLFGGWAVKHVPAMTDEKSIAMVEKLLEEDTPAVLRWVLGQEVPPREYENDVMQSLRRYANGE